MNNVPGSRRDKQTNKQKAKKKIPTTSTKQKKIKQTR